MSGTSIKNLFVSHPIILLIADHTVEKKVSITVFRHKFFKKILPVIHIFSFTIMNYLIKFVGIKYLKRKQCPAELSPIIIPSLPLSQLLQKDSKLNWFWLIVAGSSPLYRGMRVEVLPNFKKIRAKSFSKKGDIIMWE